MRVSFLILLLLAVTPAAAATPPLPVRACGPDALESGMASYYAPGLDGNKTASGAPLDISALTAAHKTLPFGNMVMVTNRANGRAVLVRITDRGPYVDGRIIDLTPAAFGKLSRSSAKGLLRVTLRACR